MKLIVEPLMQVCSHGTCTRQAGYFWQSRVYCSLHVPCGSNNCKSFAAYTFTSTEKGLPENGAVCLTHFSDLVRVRDVARIKIEFEPLPTSVR